MRLAVPKGLTEWWDNDADFATGTLRLTLKWRGQAALTVGDLHLGHRAVRVKPDPADLTDGAERVTRLLAKAFTRAGWLRPTLDPATMSQLLQIRKDDVRVEFIMDTNAMVEGIGHWLVDVFADRCDIVVTAVSLRELQDQHESAQFSQSVQIGGSDNGRLLGARQLYLAANRFREFPGYRRVLWRELELDDTALLLSRGSSARKSSESDTLLLRAVRRSIHNRVSRLERFFVTGDTALARRATSELPPGSVIAAHVPELKSDAVYFPTAWWPGPDQGYRIVRHISRLVWELLAIGDSVELAGDDGRVWKFRAFSNPMWPSDYRAPWVHVEAPNSVNNSSAPIAPDLTGTPVWPPWQSTGKTLDTNLRLPATQILDLLSAVALHPEGPIPIPAELRSSSERRYHVQLFLESLELAKPSDDGSTAMALPQRDHLTAAWQSNDLDAVFDLIRSWAPLEELAMMTAPPPRPEKTIGSARKLVSLLGQGMYVNGEWFPGAARPSVAEIHRAVLDTVPSEPPQSIPMLTLLVDLFLRKLRVSPIRVIRAWSSLWAAGAFANFEPRTGGSSSGRHTQEVARLSENGWVVERHDLESYDGYRDLVLRRSINE